MEISREVAEQIAHRLSAASTSCESSLRVVMTHQSLGEVKVYGGLVANFMGHVYADLLRQIWRDFPELEPEALKGPYVEPVAELAPEAKAAIEAFLHEATGALSFAREALGSAQPVNGLASGIREVEKSLREIEAFCEHPRFRDVG